MEHRPSSAPRFGPVLVALLIALALAPGVLAAGPLPRLAVSLPPGIALADIARTIQASGASDVLVVTSPLVFAIGSARQAPSSAREGSPAPLPSGIDVYLHVIVDIGDVGGAGQEREKAVEAELADIVRSLALEKLPVKGLIIEAPAAGVAPDVFQFTVATLVVMVKGARPDLYVSVLLPPGLPADQPDVARRVAAYADSLGFTEAALAGERTLQLTELLGGKPVVLKAARAERAAPEAARALLDILIASRAPAADIVWVDVLTLVELRTVCGSLQFLARSLTGGLELTAPERASVAVMIEDKPAEPAVAFVSGQTTDLAVLVRAAATRQAPRLLGVSQATGRTAQVACYDALDGRSLPAATAAALPGCRADAEYVLLRISQGVGDQRMFEAVNVKGRADLRVEEIIARWQASREAERHALDNWSVPCFLTLHFESTSFGMSFDVSLELQRFADRSGTNDWVQTGFFVNGVRFRKGQEFPLPMLEPDKVMTQPLELSMDQKYNYKLVGTDTVGSTLCYVIDIQPAEPTELLYAGRVWIDGMKFRQVRLQLEQRTGKQNISSHVETQDFGPEQDAQGREFTLLQRIFVEETLSVTGRPVTLEKIYRFDNYTINTNDFPARLEQVRSSENPMYRDTEQGLRTLRKDGNARVVEATAGKQIRSLVGGLMYDASYPFPIPLAGLSWVDFDFRGTGAELSSVFAGVFLAGNLSSQHGPKTRRSVEVTLSVLPSTDRVYSGDTELPGQQFRVFEQWVGVLNSWQASSSWTLTASSHATAQLFMRTGATEDSFRTPANGMVLRTWGEAKYARKNFDMSILVEPSVRLVGNRSFGYADALTTPERAWVKYQAEVNKHVYVGKLTRGGVSASFYGGTNLDRLSRYHTSFLIKPRILGIPNGVDSFDTIAIAGAYYGFNLAEIVKLSAYYDHAWARNLDESRKFQQFDGLALDIGTAGPFGTYVTASLSLAVRGNLERYGSRWGAMVMFFKPMRQ